MIPNLTDSTHAAPRLALYLNADNLVGLRADTVWRDLPEGPARYALLAADGWQGYQHTAPDTIAPAPGASPLRHCGLDRISVPADADRVAAAHVARGHECITVHVGWGLEDDAEIDRLVDATLTASARHRLPIYIETHRATITQDMWRTVQIAKRFPEVRFNIDLSHYYCGQEMPYGGVETKLAFLAPVFERTAFIHARIASPGAMQVSIDDATSRPRQAHGVADYLADFKALWTAAMRGFLKNAKPGDLLPFCPELLAGTYYYARLFPDARGNLAEESDRYAQALLYQQVARDCWTAAHRA